MKPRIAFLLPHYSHRSTSLTPGVLRDLADLGATVDVITPLDGPIDLTDVRVEHDLYVLRHSSRVALSLAGALHALGATIVNPYPASLALRDKIVATRMLQAAGVPTPATYVAPAPEDLRSLLDQGPLVVKPYQGSGGLDVSVVRTLADLVEVETGRDPVFAQRFLPPDGRDLKVYVIGGEAFGVAKVFPRRTPAEKAGEPFVLSPLLRDITARCGRAFGIDLYGVDFIESGGRSYVVDMCSIPGFRGVPDASRRLARYFYRTGERAARGVAEVQEAAS